MESVALLAALAFAINKTVTVLKALTARDWGTAKTQVLVWVVGFVGIALAAHASLSSDAVVPGTAVTFGSLDWSSQVLLAWVAGSTGSFAFDVKRALDGSDSAQEPHLSL